MSEPKSRYHDIIRVARAEDQGTSPPDNQTTRQPDSQINGKPDNQTTRLPDSPPEKLVNLCIKVPESLRRHWAAEAKRQGVTMTEVMAAALEARFGKP